MKPTYEKKWLKSQGYKEEKRCANCNNLCRFVNVFGYGCKRDPSEWCDHIETVNLWGTCDHWEKKKEDYYV